MRNKLILYGALSVIAMQIFSPISVFAGEGASSSSVGTEESTGTSSSTSSTNSETGEDTLI